MARPKKNVTALQGNHSPDYIEERLEKEKKIKGNSDNIVAPEFLLEDELGLHKFEELVEELGKADVLANVDSDLLAIYCDCWSKYITATKMLLHQDMVEFQENKLGAVTKVANPYIKVQQAYLDRILKISALFGLSPADRSKIAHLTPSDKEKESDPLVEALAKMKRSG